MKFIYLTLIMFWCGIHQVSAQLKVTATTTTGPGSTVTAAAAGAADNVIIGGGTGSGGSANTFIGTNTGTATTSGSSNTFVGRNAGNKNNTGGANTFIGSQSGELNTTGGANTFLGQYCGPNNTTGGQNTFVGQNAGGANTTASLNVFIGKNAGLSNVSGGANAFLGFSAGYYNVIGEFNSFFGFAAGMNSLVDSNSFFGALSGLNTTTGKRNTFLGTSSGQLNSTGNSNTFTGYRAGYNNLASNNSFFGTQAGTGNTSGEKNSFFGTGAGLINSIGSSNTFMGYNSGYNTFGNNNTFIGLEAGKTNTGGHYNTILGASADVFLANQDYSTAIGYGATVAGSNAMVLGGTDLASPGTNVNVGIGTKSPAANLHLEANVKEERMLINTTRNDVLSLTTLRSGTPPLSGGNPNDLLLMQTGPATPGIAGMVDLGGVYPNALPAYSSAPILPWANLAMLATKQSPLYIGTLQTQTNDYAQNIHFVTGVDTAVAAPAKLTPWECLRINKTNGFVGVHTRTAATGLPTGAPQALFHVNLTNPAQPGLDPRVNGIRFEGLPDMPHPEVIVIDADGNLAKRPYGGTGGGCGDTCNWHLDGNVINPSHFIGTLNSDDFRIRTNGAPRARITSEGNLDFGANSFVSSPVVCSALGIGNTYTASQYCMETGENNMIESSSASAAMGKTNRLNNAFNSIAGGMANEVSNTTGQGGCAVLGAHNLIVSSNESVAAGESNTIRNGHGCFIGGGHNNTDSAYNIAIGDRLSTTGHNLHAYGNQITNNLSFSIAMGFRNNRTLVLDDTGVAIQLNASAAATYKPTVNFEVQAGVTGPIAPLPMGTKRSNIRFHNLPDADDRYPSVVIDPTTGELFMSNALFPPQFKMSIGQSGEELSPISNALDLVEKIEPKQTENNSTSAHDYTYGITAENMETVLPNSSGNINLHGKNGKADKGVNYDELIPVLVQAVKDQQAQIKAQQNQINELMAVVSSKALPAIDIVLSDKNAIRLDQSVPNPADRFTSIGYYIPASVKSAVIKFADAEGKLIKSITISERGAGNVNIYLSELSSGMYTYTLIADGQLIDTKKMLVTR